MIEAFTTNRREMIQAIVFASAYGVLFYLPLVYLPQWLNDSVGLPMDQAMRINTAGTALLLALIPASGWVGDRLLRRNRWIASAMLVVAVASLPLYLWLLRDGIVSVWVAQIVLAALIAVPLGSAPALFVELFPARDRLSGYSVAYNIGLGVVGGSAPMAATWLIDVSGQPLAQAALMAVIALVGFVSVLTMRDRSRDTLR